MLFDTGNNIYLEGQKLTSVELQSVKIEPPSSDDILYELPKVPKVLIFIGKHCTVLLLM